MLCAVAENTRRCRQKYYNLKKVYNSVADFEINFKTQDTINKIPYLLYRVCPVVVHRLEDEK